jgi:hypothetical protein
MIKLTESRVGTVSKIPTMPHWMIRQAARQGVAAGGIQNDLLSLGAAVIVCARLPPENQPIRHLIHQKIRAVIYCA